jgi:hypothetical protein
VEVWEKFESLERRGRVKNTYREGKEEKQKR